MKNIKKFVRPLFINNINRVFKYRLYNFTQNYVKPKKQQQQPEININIFQEVQDLNCRACGVPLQITEVYEEGYIDQQHLKRYLVNREKKKHPDKIIQEQLNAYLDSHVSNESRSQNVKQSSTAENIQIDEETDIQKLDTQMQAYENIWSKERVDSINCLRCIRLKQNNIDEILKLNKGQKNIPKQDFVQSLFKKIGRNQAAILVLDINDIHGSYPEIMVEQINKKEMYYIVAINKIDTISNKINHDLLKQNIYDNLQQQKVKLENLTQQKIVLVSAKTGENIKNLIGKLKELSKNLKAKKIQRRLFVLGSINSGKSSFVNALMKECKHQQKNIYYKDPFDEEYKKMLKSIKTSLELQEDEKTVLVQSYVPGSTLRTIKLQIPKIGFSCYDTPGILNNEQPFNFVSDMKTISSLSYEKGSEPLQILIKQHSSVWFGALIRFDNLSVIQQAKCIQNQHIFT